MFSLQRFLGKDGKFFDLLEYASQQAVICAEALVQLLKSPDDSYYISALREARMKNKTAVEELSEIVIKTFVTVIEKEDIEALSISLYKTVKPIEKFADLFLVSKDLITPDQFTKQAVLITKATGTVYEMVCQFRKGINVEKIKLLGEQLRKIEVEADDLEIELIEKLFHSDLETKKIILIKDLYALLEKSVDLCRNTGNLITHIFLKNS